jgi:hypothetical protein
LIGEIATFQVMEEEPRQVAHEMCLVTTEPLPSPLPQFMMFLVTGFVITEGLTCLAVILVQVRDFRVPVQHIVDHRLDFMREEHSQLLADDVYTEGVDRSDHGVVLVLKRLQAGDDVFSELSGDHPVESDYEHLLAVDGEPLRMEEALDTPDEPERLPSAGAGDAADRVGVGGNQRGYLGTADAFVPRLGHARVYCLAVLLTGGVLLVIIVHPSLSATDRIVAHCDGCSCACSKYSRQHQYDD